jgi:hypothetical protein
VDQLGAPLRRGGGDVALVEQQDRQAAAGGVTGDAGAVDAGADWAWQDFLPRRF